MKRNIIFAAAAVCVALSSCVKDKEQDFIEDRIKFSASTGELETRTEYGALDDNATPSKQFIDWKSTGDKITILMGSESADYDVTRVTQGSGPSNKSKASISVAQGSTELRWGDGSSRTFYAMYPAAGTISYTPDGGSAVSNEVTSSGMTAVIPPASTVSELSELPHGYMFATKTASRSSNVSLEFGHHFTAFSFTLKNTSTESSLTLTSFKLISENHSLSGVYTVSSSNGAYTKNTEFSKEISVTGITVPAATDSTHPGEVSFTIVTFPSAFPGSGTDAFDDLTVECVCNEMTKTLPLQKDGTPISFAPLKKHNISITLPDFDNFYLTFTSSGTNTIKLSNVSANSLSIQYSRDKITWSSNWNGTTALNLNETDGRTIYLRGKNINGFTKSTYNYSSFDFGGSGLITVSGNIMSLLDWEDRSLVSIPNSYCFSRLFYDGSNTDVCLVDASNLLLPATTLKSGCYRYMFQKCASLVGAPQLPATILVDRCYGSMFSDCVSLEVAPDLPAAVLPEKCYEAMFSGCHQLRRIRIWCTENNSGTPTWLSEAGKSYSGDKIIYVLHACPLENTGHNGLYTDNGWTKIFMD